MIFKGKSKVLATVQKCAPAVLAALWATPFIQHGSTKRTPPAANAARVVEDALSAGFALRDGLVAPSADADAATTAAADAQERVPPAFDDGRFRTTMHSVTNDLERPGGVELFDRWRLRGAADDAFRIAPQNWWFRLPDGFADGLTVFSRGEIRPDARTEYFPLIFTNRVSILPQSRWHLIGANGGAGRPALPNVQTNGISVGRDVLVAPCAESGVWYALTPSNSLLVGWANAALGRNPSAPTNAVVELFRDGRFTYRYADCTAERSPILPFDLDGDGLENSVDPDPLVAGRDAHGTNAEWHLAVCSNMFEAAHGNVRPSANGIFIPDGVAWREGVNTNAYYFVDVVSEHGPAPIYFVADRESRLGSPVVVAMADETNRVPLLMGVKYAVTSEVPISVSVPADAELDAAGRDAPPCRSCISITRRSQSECDVEWPIGFTFTEAVSGSERTYSVGVVPYDPGGDFEWGGNGGIAVMSLASSASCRCASGEGRTLSFACSAECPCGGGCSVFGRYSLEGAYFAVTGGGCRCGFDDGETPSSCWCGEGGFCPCGETCYCNERNEGPYLSVSFSRKAVIFEEAYVDLHSDNEDKIQSKRSTRTTLSVAANGGPRGGRLTLSAKGLERLAPVACGPIILPLSLTLAPGETYSTEFLFEAEKESSAANDVVVEGEFIENETGDVLNRKAVLTAVRVEIRQVTRPADRTYSHPNRHTFGVCEEVRLEQYPSNPLVTWSGGTEAAARSANGTVQWFCPPMACNNPLRAECAGSTYMPLLAIIEPNAVEAELAYGVKRESIMTYGLPRGKAGGIGMRLNLFVMPAYVSFTQISVQETPCLSYRAEGYFTNRHFNGMFGHTSLAGAGEWLPVEEDNFFGLDTAAYHAEIPRLTSDGRLSNDSSFAWTSGRVLIDNPFGWRPRKMENVSDADFCRQFASETVDEITLDSDGTVGVWKLYQRVERSTNDVIWLNGNLLR